MAKNYSVRDFEDTQRSLEQLTKERARLEGAASQMLEELQAGLGVKTLKEARKKIKELEAEVEKDIRRRNKLIDVYKGLLEEVKRDPRD